MVLPGVAGAATDGRAAAARLMVTAGGLAAGGCDGGGRVAIAGGGCWLPGVDISRPTSPPPRWQQTTAHRSTSLVRCGRRLWAAMAWHRARLTLRRWCQMGRRAAVPLAKPAVRGVRHGGGGWDARCGEAGCLPPAGGDPLPDL